MIPVEFYINISKGYHFIYEGLFCYFILIGISKIIISYKRYNHKNYYENFYECNHEDCKK